MAKWEVNQFTQVEIDGKWLTGGDTFSAEHAEIDARGLRQYVSIVEEKAKEPAPNKAQDSTPNKAKRTTKRSTKK